MLVSYFIWDILLDKLIIPLIRVQKERQIEYLQCGKIAKL